MLIERNGLETTFEAMAPRAAEAIVAFRRGDPARASGLMHVVAARLSIADAAPWYKSLIAIRLGELAIDLDDPAAPNSWRPLPSSRCRCCPMRGCCRPGSIG